MSEKRGLLVVLSGPSGVGKGTVCKKLDLDRLNMRISTSMTTRSPREGEKEGISYYFVSQEQFRAAIDDNRMLEYDCHFDNYYGTPKEPVEKLRNEGKNVLLEIETNGAAQVMKQCKDTLSIFLVPPKPEDLIARIQNRGSETPEQLQKRVDRAEEELAQKSKYDYVVVNDDLDACVKEVTEIIENAADASLK